MSNVEQLRRPDEDERWEWDGERWRCDWDKDKDRDCDRWPGRPPGRPPWYGPERPPWYPGANGGISFSHRPPRHPIRGHLWWNGRELHLFDGACWVELFAPTPSDYLVFHQDTPFTGQADVWQKQLAAFAILPPGVWDVTGSCIWQFPCRGGWMSVDTHVGQLMPWLGEWRSESVMDLMTLTTPVIAFDVAAPTVIPVTLQTLGSGTAGNTSFCISARRFPRKRKRPPERDEDEDEDCE